MANVMCVWMRVCVCVVMVCRDCVCVSDCSDYACVCVCVCVCVSDSVAAGDKKKCWLGEVIDGGGLHSGAFWG